MVLSLFEEKFSVGISDWSLMMHRRIPGKHECRIVYDRQEYPTATYT